MTEFLSRSPLSFNTYADFVALSRFQGEEDAEWKDKYADFVESELMEFLTQHGPGSLLLLPEECGELHLEAPDDLRFHMADEMGDSIWFSFDIANRIGEDPMVLCEDALRRHLPDEDNLNPRVTTFAELESRAVDASDDIKVINKLGLLYSSMVADPAMHLTSLKQHPNYLLFRTAQRLARSLNKGRNDLAPFTASGLEQPGDTGQALGDYLLVLAYIAKARLNIPMQDIAQFNIAKLSHRKAHGKENDIHFDQTCVSA